jgi:hypothetical protein
MATADNSVFAVRFALPKLPTLRFGNFFYLRPLSESGALNFFTFFVTIQQKNFKKIKKDY